MSQAVELVKTADLYCGLIYINLKYSSKVSDIIIIADGTFITFFKTYQTDAYISLRQETILNQFLSLIFAGETCNDEGKEDQRWKVTYWNKSLFSFIG